MNAVVCDPADNTIIISGRTQALVKLSRDNKVIWILGCHRGWGMGGNGMDLRNYLLQPVDKNDQPITDTAILNGYTNHPDFEWNWYQHAPLVKGNGNVMMFDNGGTNRNFSGAGQYSRAVEFSINKERKRVKQVWDFGKELGTQLYSSIVSDVDFVPENNHVIISAGAVNNNGNPYGRIIEVDYQTKDISFDATLFPPNTTFTVIFHRTERLSLYP